MKGYCSQVVCPSVTLVLHALWRRSFNTLERNLATILFSNWCNFVMFVKVMVSKQPFCFHRRACAGRTSLAEPRLLTGREGLVRRLCSVQCKPIRFQETRDVT